MKTKHNMKSHKKKCEEAIKVIRESIAMEGAWGEKHRERLWPELQKLFQECVGKVEVRGVEFVEPGRLIAGVSEAVGGADVCGEGQPGQSEPEAVGAKETVSVGEAVAEPETVTMGEAIPMIDGWPVRGEVVVVGLAPNRRMLKGRIGERVVSVERKPGLQVGSTVQGKLVMAGAAPLYRAV